MSTYATNRFSDRELHADFDQLFPNGFSGADVLREVAPGGWENSPLLAIFHPTVAQVYEESLRMHRNMLELRRPNDERPLPNEPTLEEVAGDFREQPIDADCEVSELVGQCLWDVFSDGHEVLAADGRALDLGSFRASGGFLADVLNRQHECSRRYDYLDFYMGTIWVAQRADLTPVYRMIFGRLRQRGHDWVYHFPRIYAVDMRPLKDALEQQDDQPDWLNYSPSAALAKEQEEQERDKSIADMRETLDEAYRQAVDEAIEAPPPATVTAYQAVYGDFPRGWPPTP